MFSRFGCSLFGFGLAVRTALTLGGGCILPALMRQSRWRSLYVFISSCLTWSTNFRQRPYIQISNADYDQILHNQRLYNQTVSMIQTTTSIEAPIATVRRLLFEFARYPQWNPFIVKLEGQAQAQGQIHVDILLPGDSSATHFDPLVLVKNQNQFRWLGMLCCSCFFTGQHYFILRQLSPSRTEFVHGEVFKGCLTPLFSCLTQKKTRRGFELMDTVLKHLSQAVQQTSANVLAR